MSKAVLSNKILMEVTPEEKTKIMKVLTYRILNDRDARRANRGEAVEPEIIRNYSFVRDNIIAIPSGRLDLIPEGYTLVDNRVLEKVDIPDINPEYKLREDQQEVYDKVKGSCLINAKVSWGKTFAGLFIAKKFGCRTLIMVHTKVLLNQWRDEVIKLFGIEPKILGEADNDDSPIWITTVQTLTKRLQAAPTLAYKFGTVIMDEVHHLPAKTFNTCLSILRARYKIGLSGTLERKDGKHVILKDYFGPVVFRPAATNFMTPKVLVVKTNVHLPSLQANGNSWANVITQLNYDPKFIEAIGKIAQDAISMGHKVLIVGERLEALYRIHSYLPDTLAVVDSTTKNRDEIHQAIHDGDLQGIIGSITIYSEGVSVNPLSCLILAAQINNEPLLEQLIGRVTRIYPDKPTPLVIDVMPEGGISKRQHMTRLSHYMSKGYQVENVEIFV